MQKIVDDCLFYVNGNKVAFETAEQSGEFKLAVYDGKNTIVLFDESKNVYLVHNIVPDVREALGQIKELLIIERDAENEVSDGYLVKLNIDNRLEFEDNFAKDSEELYDFFEDLWQKSQESA